jgi:hypothetical protein
VSTEAHIETDFVGQGIAVNVIRRNGDRIDVLKDLGGADRLQIWETVEPETRQAPAGIRIPDDVAKALLDALLDHYRGGHDARELRKDYNAERARVDIFIKHLTQVAS